jgi:hypothetical protein
MTDGDVIINLRTKSRRLFLGNRFVLKHENASAGAHWGRAGEILEEVTPESECVSRLIPAGRLNNQFHEQT